MTDTILNLWLTSATFVDERINNVQTINNLIPAHSKKEAEEIFLVRYLKFTKLLEMVIH